MTQCPSRAASAAQTRMRSSAPKNPIRNRVFLSDDVICSKATIPFYAEVLSLTDGKRAL